MDVNKSLLFLLSVSVVIAATSVSIDEADRSGIRIVEEGHNLNLTCRIHGTDKSASEVKWYKSVNGKVVEQPHEEYIVNYNTTVLTLKIIRGIGMEHYHCGFDRTHLATIRLYIGNKPEPPNVHCFSNDQRNYWCEYSEEADTGLRSSFTMEYTTDIWSYPEEADWTRCMPLTNSVNKCYVSDSMWEQHIRVNQTNYLGTGSTTVPFYPLRDAIPSPVTDLKIDNATSRTLTISWNKASEWNYSALKYKITYIAEGSSETEELLIKRSSRNKVVRRLQFLSPYTIYSIDVKSQGYVYDGPQWSENVVVTGITLEEAPNSIVQNLTYTNSTSKKNAYKRDVMVEWKEVPVGSRHGEITGYNFYIEPSTKEESTAAQIHELSYKISGLDKFREYNVSVTASTSAGEGPNNTIVLPDLTAIPMPPEMEECFPIARSTNSIDVKWKEPENPHGYIEYYLLQWSINKVCWEPKDVPLRVNSSHLNYTVKDLQEDTEYYFRLGIENKVGMSEMKVVNRSVKTLHLNKKGINQITIWAGLLGVSSSCIAVCLLIYYMWESRSTKHGQGVCNPITTKNSEGNKN